MSFDIPTEIEHDIQRYAQQEHITPEEAVLRLIEAGLAIKNPARREVFQQGLGLFGSPEDSALLDEVVLIAHQERRRATEIESTI